MACGMCSARQEDHAFGIKLAAYEWWGARLAATALLVSAVAKPRWQIGVCRGIMAGRGMHLQHTKSGPVSTVLLPPLLFGQSCCRTVRSRCFLEKAVSGIIQLRR